MIGTYWDPYVSNNPLAPSYSDSAAIRTDVARFKLARSAYINLITGKSNYAAFNGNPCHLGTSTGLANYLLYLGSRTGMYVLVANTRFHRNVFYNQDSAAVLTRYYTSLDPGRRSVFYGYNVRDEPDYLTSTTAALCGGRVDGSAPGNQSWAAYFRSNDTSRLAYINLYPRSPSTSEACYEAYLDDFLNPADPSKALDVASYDNYPFASNYPNGISPLYFYNLNVVRKKAGTRPMWVYPLTIEHVSGRTNYLSPSDEHFRFMAFCPIAYGAKGLVYFTYVLPNCPGNPDSCPQPTTPPNPFCGGTALVVGADTPTAKFNKVKMLNHFITKLAGPMVMGSTWLGAYHKSSSPSAEVMRPEWLVNANRTPIVSNLSDPSSMVGVFRSNASPSVYYLLVVNKALASRTTTVTLKGNHTGNVMLAPTVVGYAGDTTYTSASTSYHPTVNQTTFTLKLSGGEGRQVRIKNVTSRS